MVLNGELGADFLISKVWILRDGFSVVVRFQDHVDRADQAEQTPLLRVNFITCPNRMVRAVVAVFFFFSELT